MEFAAIAIVAALTFGICFLADKGFAKTFRGKKEHRTGLSVRQNKKYGAFGLIFVTLGIAAIFAGLSDGWVLIAGGALVALTGCGLTISYLCFGIFYDEETFLLTTIGKKTVQYRYEQIRAQQLFNSFGNIVIELQLEDGRSVQLNHSMTGVYAFMDKAFEGWCRQKGIDPESCEFHDPQNSCWFPKWEDM